MTMTKAAVVVITAFFTTVMTQDMKLPPRFIVQPNRQYYFKVDDATFTQELPCRAKGIPEPYYEWKKFGELLSVGTRGWNWKPNGGGTISINGPDFSDEGYYQCLARNTDGMVAVSTVAFFQRARAGAFPYNQTVETKVVREGENVTLVCSGKPQFPYAAPNPTIQWELYTPASGSVKETQAIMADDKRRQVDQSGALRFAFVTRDDSQPNQQYRCSAYNSLLKLSVFGSPVKLSVDSTNPLTVNAPKLMYKTAPEPSSGPSVVFLKGQNRTLSCIFAGKPVPTIRWYKLDANGRLMNPDGIVDKTQNLVIQVVNFDHEGTYRCTGSNPGGSQSAEIQVAVEAAPFWTKTGRPKDTNVTAGDDFTFECGTEGIPAPDKPKFYSNGVELDLSQPRIVYDEQEPTKFTLKNVSKADLQVFQCNVSNKHDYLYASVYLNVLLRTQLLVEPEQNVSYEEDNKPTNVRFNCSAKGDPMTPLTFTWMYNTPETDKWMPLPAGGPYTFIMDNEHAVDLDISLEKGSVHAQYKCVVENGYMPAEVLATLWNENAGPTSISIDPFLPVWTLVAAVATTLALSLLSSVVIAVIVRRKRRQRYADDAPEMNEELMQTPPAGVGSYEIPLQMNNGTSLSRSLHGENEVADDVPMYLEVPTLNTEIPRTHVRVHAEIGSGSFGQVYMGEIYNQNGQGEWTAAAVKTVRDPHDSALVKDLKDELKVMQILRPHPNVVTLFASCTRDGGVPMIILEYLPNGNLQTSLRNDRARNKAVYNNLYGASASLTSRDLMKYAVDVANGMAFLSSMSILHRDLAARNVLLSDDKRCKVSDFGFARDVIESHQYEMKSQGRVPVRWMSPEALNDQIFTSQSDVWAYGVLLWEIVTLGCIPYPGMSAEQVMRKITNGYRMPRPQHCSQDMYGIMLSCWEGAPNARPSFKDLTSSLNELLVADYDVLTFGEFEEALYDNVDKCDGDEKC
ncbi:fibroblast growth factor receptor 4-like isoform X2 [Lingula anatina]|uniref:receptor protein-tyrosine kinase n=1 Tax=Lingula anatina TaxID=7574 RepID=A0A1S3I658_LINAN|nr:fibroblast growth factor receptor 4-like isoform X2 [Lingula anatina]|eukprot:XP_013393693.1 fibroblast growth factor receptor 4-like isoform X2 [Lingula anatina]